MTKLFLVISKTFWPMTEKKAGSP